MAESVLWHYNDGDKHAQVTIDFDGDYGGMSEANLVATLISQAMLQLGRAKMALASDDPALDAWIARVKSDRPTGASSSSSSSSGP